MRDGHPREPVLVRHVERIAVVGLVGGEPELGEPVGRERLAGCAGLVRRLLEPQEGGRVEDGAEGALEVRGDERTSHGGVRLARDEVVRDQELGEGGRDLGDGGRRLEGERVPRRSGQNALPLRPGRGSASIRPSSKKARAMSPSSGARSAKALSIVDRASPNGISSEAPSGACSS